MGIRVNLLRDAACALCGRIYGSHVVREQMGVITRDGHDLGMLCPNCASLGPGGAAEALRQRARLLTEIAEVIDDLPTEDWPTQDEDNERGVSFGVDSQGVPF